MKKVLDKTICELSILILYYNKVNEIKLLLESLLNQTIDRKRFEIIIIDDGSEASIRECINEYINRGLLIHLQEIEHTGNRAYNRKLAAKLARSPKFVFYDADMIPAKDFVEKHISNLSKGDEIISLGYRRLLNPFSFNVVTPEIVRNNFSVIEAMPCELDERIPMIYAHKKYDIELSRAWYIAYGHTIGINKVLYESIEGQDDNFSNGWGAEDIEFCLQLYRAGGRFLFDESIMSYHIAHGSSDNKTNQYLDNLQYFFDKYKSFEPELFMLQHLQDAVSMTRLYDIAYKGLHLKKFEINTADLENTLFVGFKETSKSIYKKNNRLISTDDELAEYKLIGSHLPYSDSSFEQVILSDGYSIFQTDFLYEIIKELLRVGKTVKVQSNKKLIELDDFWKSITGYTVSAFKEIKKVRIVATPGSENKEKNILYFELTKALNENGYYASLELTYDELKDKQGFLSCSNNDILEKAYYRNLRLLNEKVYSVIDSLVAGNNRGYRDNLIWWGDIPYYNQDENLFLQSKRNYTKLLVRKSESYIEHLRPGIRSKVINQYLDESSGRESEGILLIDLNLNNAEIIQNFISLIRNDTSKVRMIPITIVIGNTMKDEFSIYKNLALHMPKELFERQISRVKQYQADYCNKLQSFIQNVCSYENVQIVNSNGMLDEIDKIIQRNSIFVDLKETREFNPYLIEAAAYGLKVYTTSDLYEDYKYPNICNVNYKIVNAIGDFDYPYDSERKLRPEIISNKRLIDTDSLVSLILSNCTEVEISKEELMMLNDKNKRLDEFCQTVAHDIRGPLGGLIMRLEYLNDKFDNITKERIKDIITTSLGVCERLVSQVQAMYEFAKLGKEASNMEFFDLNELINALIEDLNFSNNKNIKIEIDKFPKTYGSKELVKRLFLNLITNAIKYNDKEEKSIKIGFNGEENLSAGTFAKIYVKDNGNGISKEDLGNVFKLFNRASENNSKKEGLGVGLTVVERVIELHLGKINIESEIGKGTYFKFLLPIEKI